MEYFCCWSHGKCFSGVEFFLSFRNNVTIGRKGGVGRGGLVVDFWGFQPNTVFSLSWRVCAWLHARLGVATIQGGWSMSCSSWESAFFNGVVCKRLLHFSGVCSFPIASCLHCEATATAIYSGELALRRVWVPIFGRICMVFSFFSGNAVIRSRFGGKKWAARLRAPCNLRDNDGLPSRVDEECGSEKSGRTVSYIRQSFGWVEGVAWCWRYDRCGAIISLSQEVAEVKGQKLVSLLNEGLGEEVAVTGSMVGVRWAQEHPWLPVLLGCADSLESEFGRRIDGYNGLTWGADSVQVSNITKANFLWKEMLRPSPFNCR